jgi:nuclease S1
VRNAEGVKQEMMRRSALAILACPIAAFAWGSAGHSLIARIAEVQLSDPVRARVAAILGPGRTLSSVASWADDVRRSRPETYNWHFINIPIHEPGLDMARHCPAGDCVIARIRILREMLRDPATAPAARTEALMFLVHFVGDMHQPLHCGDNHDKGGNEVRVSLAGKITNLHSAWDHDLPGRIGSKEQLFHALSEESSTHARKWRRGMVEDWAEESHDLAKRKVYGKLPKASPDTPILLGAKYEKMANPVIRKQLAKAGARLARVLNEALQ